MFFIRNDSNFLLKRFIYKIELLGCHSNIELRLIEVEVNFSGISLTSFRGQCDTFLMADNFHSVRYFFFPDFLIFLF